MDNKVKALLEKHKDDKNLTSERDYIKAGLDWSGAILDSWCLKYLDLSYNNFENTSLQNTNLIGANFRDAILENSNLKNSILTNACFENANMLFADLEDASVIETFFKNASLIKANLKNVDILQGDFSNALLMDADLKNAKISQSCFNNACLVSTDFRGAQIDHETSFNNASFFQSILTNSTIYNSYENIDKIVIEEKSDINNNPDFLSAENVYRILKTHFSEDGMYNIAGHYYYREMLMKGKIAWSQKKWFRNKSFWSSIGNFLLKITTGYGEHWWLVLLWWFGIVFCSGTGYYFLNVVQDSNGNIVEGFWENIYFSCVTFTTLGFGDYYPGRFQLLVAFEAFVGAFFMALFIFVFVRKLNR